jgi:predicted Zn-ribbon and HTH transcriptional regulator
VVDERDRAKVGDSVFVVVFDGTLRKAVGKVERDERDRYVRVNGKKEYLEDLDEVRIIKNENEARLVMQPHYCRTCDYAKEFTNAPRTRGRFRDGVYCESKEMAEALGLLEEYAKHGHIHLWRIEVLEGETAECKCWKQRETSGRTKGLIASLEG